MITSDRKLKELAVLLEKKDELIVMGAIENLREEESFEGAIKLIADYYDAGQLSVRKAIENFLNDIKDNELRSEVVAEIRRKHEPETTRMLVSSCWQSGLDYSDFVYDFAEMFLEGDFSIALECYTVIEESAHLLTNEQKDKIRSLFENSPLPDSDSKKMLGQELVNEIEKAKE